jgi:hypothetical protein
LKRVFKRLLSLSEIILGVAEDVLPFFVSARKPFGVFANLSQLDLSLKVTLTDPVARKPRELIDLLNSVKLQGTYVCLAGDFQPQEVEVGVFAGRYQVEDRTG